MTKTKQMPNMVYEELKKEIMSLKLPPGSSVAEIETSKRFGVSRTPVRDAIRRLESEGLLNVVPHIGTYVSQIDLEKIGDVIYIREKVESAIIEDLHKTISTSQLLTLKTILAKQEELLDSKQQTENIAREFIILDNEFHKAIFDFAGKSRIWSLFNEVDKDYVRFRVFIDLSNLERLKNLYEGHKKILKVIEDKTEFDIRQELEYHLYDGVKNSTDKIFENANFFKYISEN